MEPLQENAAITADVLQAFDNLNGPHPGFRPAHAKGILIAGRFTPSPDATSLTRAPHLSRRSTPVTVRFSNATGLPNIPDSDPSASPHGMAIRFHLAEHVHTDIIAHSVDGFPVRTPEEFLELLCAIHASGPGRSSPTPMEIFLGTHPAALAFVQAPKPAPVSFLTESYFSPNAYQFVNAGGESVYGRYRILPEGASEFLAENAAAGRAPDFLFDDLRERLAKGTAKMTIAVQIGEEGDIVNDATVHWPDSRRQVVLGAVELMSVVCDNEVQQRRIIFDPIPRIDGIEPSDDPLLEFRAALYLTSGRRRRKEVA